MEKAGRGDFEDELVSLVEQRRPGAGPDGGPGAAGGGAEGGEIALPQKNRRALVESRPIEGVRVVERIATAKGEATGERSK
jgi:hypothetical protein